MNTGEIIAEPGDRICGIDACMIATNVRNVLREMERKGWTVGEVELFAKAFSEEIEVNKERLRKSQPFRTATIKAL